MRAGLLGCASLWLVASTAAAAEPAGDRAYPYSEAGAVECMAAAQVIYGVAKDYPAIQSRASEIAAFYLGRLTAGDHKGRWMVTSAERQKDMTPQTAAPIMVRCQAGYDLTWKPLPGGEVASPGPTTPRKPNFLDRLLSAGPGDGESLSSGRRVYSASECIGAVVNGTCHGSIMPQPVYHPACYGEMINGICTGPMF